MPFLSDSIVKCSQEWCFPFKLLYWHSLIIINILYSVVNLQLDFLGFSKYDHPSPRLFYSFCRGCIHIFIFVKHILQCRNVFVSVCGFNFCATFVYVCLCLHGCKWALLRLPQSVLWSGTDGCLVPKDWDSWRKLELRARVMIGKGGGAREVITIKPLQREHPSASFPPLGMWHRCKMPPRLIYPAACTLNKFILKLAVKQN